SLNGQVDVRTFRDDKNIIVDVNGSIGSGKSGANEGPAVAEAAKLPGLGAPDTGPAKGASQSAPPAKAAVKDEKPAEKAEKKDKKEETRLAAPPPPKAAAEPPPAPP